MARLMSQRLDRRRPLWEIWLVEGLAEDQWALITKVHHCMVDGVSGVDLLTVVLDIDPGVQPQPPEPWSPAAPTVRRRPVWSTRGRAWRKTWSGSPAGCRAQHGFPSPCCARHGTTSRASSPSDDGCINTPPLSIEGSIGPHRVWCHSSVDLDDVRADPRQRSAARQRRRAGRVRRRLPGAAREAGRGRRPTPSCARSCRCRSEAADAHGMSRQPRVGVAVRAARTHRQSDRAAPESSTTWPTSKASHMAEVGEAITTIGDIVPPIVVGGDQSNRHARDARPPATQHQHRDHERARASVPALLPGPRDDRRTTRSCRSATACASVRRSCRTTAGSPSVSPVTSTPSATSTCWPTRFGASVLELRALAR